MTKKPAKKSPPKKKATPKKKAAPKTKSTKKAAWTTDASVAAIRKTFDRLNMTYTETGKATRYFDIEADGEIEAMKAVYEPGTLALYLVFGVHPPKKYLPQFLALCNRVNNTTHTGCLMVRESSDRPDELTVMFRVTVEHRVVKDLREEYVASAIMQLIDMAQAVDVMTITVGKGGTVDEACAHVFTAPGFAKIAG